MKLVLCRQLRAAAGSLPKSLLQLRSGWSFGVAIPGTPVSYIRRLRSVTTKTSEASPYPPQRYRQLHCASNLQIVLLLVFIACLTDYIWGSRAEKDSAKPSNLEVATPSMATDMTNVLPGRLGNLSAEEEEKLRKLWALMLNVFGVAEDETPAGDGSESTGVSIQKQASFKVENPKTKKKRLYLFGRKADKAIDAEPVTPAAPASVSATIKESDQEDKYGQNKQFLDALANQSPESIRATLWSMVKHDHPDALVLRFLRARKWDINKALVMLISTMNWRAMEMHVDDDIMKNGEAGALEAENGPDGKSKTIGHDFLTQIRTGKSLLHGIDKNGRPICIVRVRYHKPGEQCEEGLERYTVYLIETARMTLTPPIDTAVNSTIPLAEPG